MPEFFAGVNQKWIVGKPVIRVDIANKTMDYNYYETRIHPFSIADRG